MLSLHYLDMLLEKLLKVLFDLIFYHEDKIVAHFHEWMTGTGILYLEKNVPYIATVFTTHATALGRSIAGNGFPFI